MAISTKTPIDEATIVSTSVKPNLERGMDMSVGYSRDVRAEHFKMARIPVIRAVGKIDT